MNTKIFTGISAIVLFALLSIAPDGILTNEISVNKAQAYYGSYSAGNVQATGRVTTRGTGTIGGHTVTYYPNLPGTFSELKC